MRRAVVVLSTVLAVAGCASIFAPREDPSRFFALTVEAGEGTPPVERATGKTIGVGPVRLPAYLDRNELCVRVSGTELRYAARERWAAPLRSSVPWILTQDLAALAPVRRYLAYPWAADAIDATVEVDVERFEASTDGRVTLIARWIVRDAKRSVLATRTSRHEREASAEDPDAAVAALSKLLADLAMDVAAAL